MRRLKVVLYNEQTKETVENEKIPGGEIELNPANESAFIELFLKVDELMVGSKTFTVITRRFSIDTDKLILNVRQKV